MYSKLIDIDIFGLHAELMSIFHFKMGMLPTK